MWPGTGSSFILPKMKAWLSVITFGGPAGKLILSIFRIIAVIVIGIYISRLQKKSPHPGLIFSFSLIMAGALGNIIDSAFYGLIFNASSYHQCSYLVPARRRIWCLSARKSR